MLYNPWGGAGLREKSAEFAADRQAARLAERAELFPPVNKNAVSQIDIFGGQICCVGLRCAGLIKQLVICAAFGISFRSDDCIVFFGSNRSFTLAVDFGPCSFCEDGPRKPTEIDRQVVKPMYSLRVGFWSTQTE